MDDSRNRLYSTRFQLRPKFISTGSRGSRRVQRLHGISTHYSSAQPEDLENADGFETGRVYADAETNHANGYARVQNHSLLIGHGGPMSRLSLSGTVPAHGSEYQSSFPMWGTADSGMSLSVEQQAMGESAVKVNIQGQPLFPLSSDVVMTSSNTVSGEGSFSEVMRDDTVSHGEGSRASGSVSFAGILDPVFEHKSENGTHFMFNAARGNQNFTQVPTRYSSAPAAGASVHPVDTSGRRNSYGSNDNTFWCEANTEPNHGATSSIRGPFKRKISALGSPVIGSESVSAQMSNTPARYNPVISRGVNNGRRIGHSSPNSTFAFSGPSTGQTFVPANALPEGSRVQSLNEPHFAQGRGFLRELPIRHSEPLRGNRPFGTLISDEIVMQCNQDNISGSIGIESERASTNSFPAYTQAMPIENTAPQAHLWSSRRIQQGAISANTNPTGELFGDFFPSVDQLSGSHGGHNHPISSHGRENSSLRITAGGPLGSSILENGVDHNHSASRVGQMVASNQSLYEGFRADGSIRNLTMNNGGSVSRNWMNSHSHSMSSVNALPNFSFSDHQTRRVPSCPPWAQSRNFNHPTTWSTTLMSSAAPPSSSATSANFRRHPSSAHLFGAPQMESSIERFNESFPSATARMPAGLPLHRVYRVRANDDHRRHDMSDGVAEQLLMLEATVLFGDVGLQDQHSDWRLDVDNMSYEELLALEERIGNVCTGLTEDGISEKLKTIKYSFQKASATSALQETEVKCSVCQEEYEEGENLGCLECGHSYHAFCIKQWLVKKNQCPVCKASAFS